MNKKNVLLTTVLSVALVPGTAGIAEAAIIQAIDPLSAVQTTVRTNSGGTTNNDLTVTGTIFGSSVNRRLSVTKQGGSGNGEAKIPTTNFGPGLEVNNVTGANSLVTLRYGSPTFAPVDLTVGGLADRVSLGIIANDTGSTNVATVFTVTINGISQTLSLGDKPSTSPVLPLDFLFSSFPLLNPTSVTSFSLVLNPAVEGDIAISFLAVGDDVPPPTTPEPATMLGLLAVAGAASAFRKKNQQAK